MKLELSPESAVQYYCTGLTSRSTDFVHRHHVVHAWSYAIWRLVNNCDFSPALVVRNRACYSCVNPVYVEPREIVIDPLGEVCDSVLPLTPVITPTWLQYMITDIAIAGV